MDLRTPNIDRLLEAISIEETDRVPNFEVFVMRRTLMHIMGEQRIKEIGKSNEMERIRHLYSVETEGNKTNSSPLETINYNIFLPPSDNLELLQATGVDAAMPMLSWLPKTRDNSQSRVVAYDQKGIVRDWEDLDRIGSPPGVEKMMELVDWYLEVFEGTGVGVGPMCRSCFCNTYEIMGMENFMFKLYDDIRLVERIMDILTDYNTKLTTELSKRNIDLFWLDDDLAFNNGFLVPPHFILDLWMPRTKDMLKPIKEMGIPMCMHCCANVKDVIPIAIELGIKAIHPFQPNCNDIYALKKEYGNDICFVGNMDLAGVLSFGTPEEVVEDTKKHIDRLASGGGYVVCSSHSITDDVPPENYLAMIETAQTYIG